MSCSKKYPDINQIKVVKEAMMTCYLSKREPSQILASVCLICPLFRLFGHFFSFISPPPKVEKVNLTRWPVYYVHVSPFLLGFFFWLHYYIFVDFFFQLNTHVSVVCVCAWLCCPCFHFLFSFLYLFLLERRGDETQNTYRM